MYGGTKTEMERLIKDAEKLDKSFKAQRDGNGKLTLSFADVVNGIHIVQQNMGITGTSAEEAGTTIQGSMASVKAAWQDTLTAIGSGKDIDKKLDNFTRSVKKYGENMKPVIKQALSGAVKVIGELAPDVAAELPKLITELAPDVLKAGADIVTNLANGVLNELDRSNFDETAGKLTEKVNKIIDGFDAEKSGERFSRIINKFINAGFNIASTFDFKNTAEKMTTWLNKAVGNLDVAKLGQTVSHVWKGVWDFIGTALEEIDWENIGQKIGDFISNIDWGGILNSIFKAIGGFIKAMPSLLKGLIENLDFESASSFFAFMLAPKMAGSLLNKFKTDTGVIGKLTSAGQSAGTTIGGGITDKATGIGSTFASKFSAGLSAAGAVIEAAIVGWQIGTLIYNAAKPAIDEITDYMSGLGKGGGLSPEEQQEARRSNKNRNRLIEVNQFMGKWGFNYRMTREDVDKNSKAYKVIRNVMTIMEKYPSVVAAGYSPTRIAYDPELREQILKGNLPKDVTTATPTTSKPTINNPTDAAAYHKERQQNWKNNASFYKPGSSAATTGINSAISDVNSATNIYLDTGKLVGGTSRTSATQNNYAMRGYAT